MSIFLSFRSVSCCFFRSVSGWLVPFRLFRDLQDAWDYVHNPYGLLRTPWNTDPTPYVTRHNTTNGQVRDLLVVYSHLCFSPLLAKWPFQRGRTKPAHLQRYTRRPAGALTPIVAFCALLPGCCCG